MDTKQEKYITKLRGTLGKSINKIRTVMSPLKLKLEVGKAWTASDFENALSVVRDAVDVCSDVAVVLQSLVKHHSGSSEEALSMQESSYLKSGARWLEKGAELLSSITPHELEKIDESDIIVKRKGKKQRLTAEEFFVYQYKNGLAHMLIAWGKMYFATSRLKSIKIVLTRTETDAIYDPDDNTSWHNMIVKADAQAEYEGKAVEVYDADKEIAYTAIPPQPGESRAKGKVRSRWEWQRGRGRKAFTSALTFSEKLSSEQREYVKDMVSKYPGITIQEIAAGLGMETVPVAKRTYSPNPCYYVEPNTSNSEVDQYRDMWMHLYE